MKDKIINMQIWDAVKKTNPKYTKKVGFGRKFTSINAQYQIQSATEQFGPIGDGWGVENERFFVVCEGLLGYQAMLWYKCGDDKYTYDINSSINTHNKSGKLDDECFKKVSTDALTKGLSKLGFNADVFLGQWDDNRYVAQMEKEFSSKPVSLDTPHPKNTFKKNMSSKVLDAMLDYIKNGKANDVLKKLHEYKMTEEQDKTIKDAITKIQHGGKD